MKLRLKSSARAPLRFAAFSASFIALPSLALAQEAPAAPAVVPATDAATSHRIMVVATAPEAAHDPIVYPIAAVAKTGNDSAVRDFFAFLRSPAARTIFERHGFRMA